MPTPWRPERSLVLALALLIDAATGDPPTRLHPVGAMGAAARRVETLAPHPPAERRGFGLVAGAGLPLLAAALAWAVERLTPGWARLPITALGLATMMSLRMLLRRAGEVAAALDGGHLPEARRLLAWHLVSRDTQALDAHEVAGATIESLAENLGDGIVGPCLAYALAGLPGAAAYRMLNTLDSLWGYRDERYADLGFGAARLDDLANLAPARVAAASIALAAALDGRRGSEALAWWRRDGGRTASPNAGQPMAAMAGALGVELAKRDHYVLGDGLPQPSAADIRRAQRITALAALLAAVALAGLRRWRERRA